MRAWTGNLPAIVGLLIMVSFSTDLPFLRDLKTEYTFGLWVVVLVPLAILSFMAQLLIWWRWPRTRPWRGDGLSS